MTPSPDLFEFFSGGGSAAVDMYSADDIIHQGKLLLYKVRRPPPLKIPPFDHRRWESFDGLDLRRRRGGGGLTAEYHKLRRAVSESIPRAPPPPPLPPPVKLRPRWYLFAFGSVKVPAEMEMRDIKNRQGRRNSPVVETNGWGCDGGKGAWQILRSLSCKGTESTVAFTAPSSIVSHVREVSSGPF